MANGKKLRRSVSNRMVAGVCGGVADYFGIDPVLVRLIYAILTVCSVGFPGIIIYLICWIIIPEQ